MELTAEEFRFKNPDTQRDLVLPIKLVNTETSQKTLENFRHNIKLDIPWLNESEAHGGTAIICGASPSLRTRFHRLNGDVFACNRAAEVLREADVKPKYQVLMDALEETILDVSDNAEQHLISSIVSPKLHTKLKNPIIWHPLIDWIVKELDGADREFMFIGGGITVTNSAICIAYIMGYRKIIVLGVDSSFVDDKFYSYQANAQSDRLFVDVEVNGKSFKTSYDMKQQVVVMLKLVQMLRDLGCSIEIDSDGLMGEAYKSMEIQHKTCENQPTTTT